MRHLLQFVGVAVAVAIATATALALIWLRDESLEPVFMQAQQQWVAIATEPAPFEERLNYRMTRSDVVSIPAPRWTGTVTDLRVRVGDTLNAGGEPPIVIDGLGRPWFPAPAPLYRPIGRGLSGADVDLLASFLVSSGDLDPEAHERGTPVDHTMVSAIGAWSTAHGFGPRTTEFDPSWIAWFPPGFDGITITQVATAVGELAPAMGQGWVSAGAIPIALTVRSDGFSRPSVVQVEGTVTTIVIDGTDYMWTPDGLDPAGLSALAALLGHDQEDVSLLTRHTYVAGAAAVPPSALVPTDDGYCMTVSAEPDSAASRRLAVQALGSRAGIAVVDAGTGYVLINPLSAPGSLCP